MINFKILLLSMVIGVIFNLIISFCMKLIGSKDVLYSENINTMGNSTNKLINILHYPSRLIFPSIIHISVIMFVSVCLASIIYDDYIYNAWWDNTDYIVYSKIIGISLIISLAFNSLISNLMKLDQNECNFINDIYVKYYKENNSSLFTEYSKEIYTSCKNSLDSLYSKNPEKLKFNKQIINIFHYPARDPFNGMIYVGMNVFFSVSLACYIDFYYLTDHAGGILSAMNNMRYANMMF